jgi:phosphohistidine phosphatase
MVSVRAPCNPPFEPHRGRLRGDRSHYGVERSYPDVGELTVPTLHLLRHAKSSWDDSQLADHDRPLAPRGRRAAQNIGQYLRQHRIVPALVLCSSARRTRETLDLITPVLGAQTVTRVLDSLYLADADDLLDHVRRVSAGVPSVMVVGHNPGLHDLAQTLAAGAGPALGRLRVKFPTGALATLRVRGKGWHELTAGCADLVDFTMPRDLEQTKAGHRSG